MQLPQQLKYTQLQSKAFFSYFKQWPIQPISNGGQYFPGQVIRVFFNALTQGVMDPYRSHLQITVQTDVSVLPVGLLQVDNSAQSFIQQMVIVSKNRQIERILQYGCLAAYLSDIGISQYYTQGRQTQGLGYSNLSNYEQISTKTSFGNFSSLQIQSGGRITPIFSNTGCLPTMPPRIVSLGGQSAANVQFNQTAIGPLSGVFRSNLSILNASWITLKQVDWWYRAMTSNDTAGDCTDTTRTTQIAHYGYTQNVRAEYISHMLENDYIDTNTSIPKNQIHLDQSVYNATFPAKFTNNTVYKVSHPTSLPVTMQYGEPPNTQWTNYQAANISGLWGYSNMYSPNFSKGVWQPFISPTVPQCQMVNGVILTQKIPVSRRIFKVPLISAVMGLLIPSRQFVLLPVKAFNDLILELTVDPYAMFTSGYNDISEFDNVGMGLMQQRAFKISRIVYNMHTYQFYSPQMDQYLKTSLISGIAINTNYWQMGNQYQIQNSQSVTNAWPVACNQEALNQILVLFYPLDYQIMSFCRKHFRISNNITKLQLRINMQYYPSQPLSGNGGNPIEVDMYGSNGIYLEQINLSNGYLFSNLSPAHRINAYNFAINDRCYNIYNTHTFYDANMIDAPQYKWGAASVNNDTGMGMSLLHQNRYVGKAAYLFSFEPYAHSKNLLNGIDCRLAKQFQIIFSQNPDGYFPRPQMMLIFTRSSVIIQYGINGIVNINK